MKEMFEAYYLGQRKLANRFVLPPIKLGSGNPDGSVSERQLEFYRKVSGNGPAVIILEPVSVTPEGREHPRQLCVHLSNSTSELKKIVDSIHAEERLACLHLNHAGAAAHPKVIGMTPKAPSAMTCIARENKAEPLTEEGIGKILNGYESSTRKAVEAGFDLIEVQAGHGYLVSQFLNGKLNKRDDRYGKDRLLFAREVLGRVKENAQDLTVLIRISGDEMSPEFGLDDQDLFSLIQWSEDNGIAAIHVGMGNACFSPPWYFHHSGLPLEPQTKALSKLRQKTSLPLIAAGRMGRKERIQEVTGRGLADLVALGRPLIADPGIIEKWRTGEDETIIYCGYCLQGCLHRMKSGEVLGCNINPEVGLPPLSKTKEPQKVLIAGGGPAGMSAALYLTRRGHRVTLAEKSDHLGGQFFLAWQAKGKEPMKDGLDGFVRAVKSSGASILLERPVEPELMNEVQPDLLVWAVGSSQNIPDIPGLSEQNVMTAQEYLKREQKVRGPRVLVIGAGRTGLEIAENLGGEGHEVVATKRTDPIGSMMEAITRKLALMRIGRMPNVTLMPHTTVKAFYQNSVDVEQDGNAMSFLPFQTVILSSGMVSEAGPSEEIRKAASRIETIGDASEVKDIFTAVQAGYRLAQTY